MRNDRLNQRLIRYAERLDRREARREQRAACFVDLSFNHRGSISARLAVGLVIITLGVIYLADSLGIVGTHRPERFFWPAVFAAIGITLLIEKKSMSSHYWAYGWLLAAFIEFSYQVYWIPVGIGKLLFPLILLFIGARLVQRTMNGSTDRFSIPTNSQHRTFAFLSGAQMRSFSEPLTEIEVTAILGGVKIDLTNATIDGERATLHVTAVMGGIEIVAPSEWKIVSEVTPILGAFIDKRRPTATVPTKTLFVNGVVVMGGIEVKNY